MSFLSAACQDTIPSTCTNSYGQDVNGDFSNKTCHDYAKKNESSKWWDNLCYKNWNEFSDCDRSTAGQVKDTCRLACKNCFGKIYVYSTKTPYNLLIVSCSISIFYNHF